MLEEFVGEDGTGMNLIDEGKFSEALIYFDNMLRKYPRSVYFRASKALALIGLKRYGEAVPYLDEIVQISDYWKKEYHPTFCDLSDVTCSALFNKALCMMAMNNKAEISVCYNKVFEISEFLSALDKDYYERIYSKVPDEHKANHPIGNYYRVLPYRLRIHLRRSEIDELIKDLSEFLTECPPHFLDMAKQELHAALMEDREYESIKNNPQLLELLEKTS